MMDANNLDNDKILRDIIKRYISGKATPEEIRFLEAHYNHFEANETIVDRLSDNEKQELEQKMLSTIFQSKKTSHPVRRMVFTRWAAAALLVGVVISAAFYFYQGRPAKTERLSAEEVTVAPKNDIDPGGNKAILTLTDGRKITLDDVKAGEISREGNAVITKTDDGRLVYDLSAALTKDSNLTYNKIQTPKGGEYQVVLPDRTSVWLNSASTLEFPTAFTGKERIVKLTGEGYFEVAKDASKPFYVKVRDVEVKVLGTHFNIMAYEDEREIQTTLVEGAVRVSRGGEEKKLSPGQQAAIGVTGGIAVNDTDVEAALAWRNGYFNFQKDNIQTVMRQLSRWYDMEVIYQNAIPKDEFTGKIRRNIKASKALQFLELAGVHFKIENNKVIVL